MTPKEKAEKIYSKYFQELEDSFFPNSILTIKNKAKKCALIAVDEIINSNPHSNPLNTDVYSTMKWWQEVKQEIEKL